MKFFVYRDSQGNLSMIDIVDGNIEMRITAANLSWGGNSSIKVWHRLRPYLDIELSNQEIYDIGCKLYDVAAPSLDPADKRMYRRITL